MIIHQPEIKIEGKEIIVSSRIETKADVSIPKSLWFKFPIQYQDAVTDRADGFFTSLMLLGMHLNEDIEVRGEISPKLANNIDQLQLKYLSHEPKKLNQVDFNFKKIKQPNPTSHRNINLASFSAGADSFYTYWSHFYPKMSKHPVKITHGLFIHGYDLILQNQENYDSLFSSFQNLFDDWGLPLIKATINAYSFYQFRIRWVYALIPALIGTVNTLGNQVTKFYQPGNYEPNPNNPQYASSYLNLFSTETLSFQSHAKELTRMEKTIKILDWEPVQKNLRVCSNMSSQTGLIGCGKCDKCLATSLVLNIHDKHELFPFFSKKYTLSKNIYFFWKFTYSWRLIKRGYLKLFKEKKRFDLIILFWLILPLNYLRFLVFKKIIPLFPKSLIYSVKKIVYRSNTSPSID